jgi:carbonic anhydrase
MRKLVEGLHQFQSEVFASHSELFQRLEHGQNPDAMFITCSDSRVDPTLLTQTIPGDLFVLRNAGNIIPPHSAGSFGEASTIEFALEVLEIRDIIVCGHSHCGAANALLRPEKITNMPNLVAWLSNAESARRLAIEHYPGLTEEELLNVVIQENVLVQLENLKTHPAVAERLERNELSLHGWVYKFETGEVFSYRSQDGQFLPLTETPSIK